MNGMAWSAISAMGRCRRPRPARNPGKVSGVNILAVNVGSSSLKLRLLGDDDDVLATEDLHDLGPDELAPGIAAFFDRSPAVDVVGHRVVHGGSVFTSPVRLDLDAEATLVSLADLDPLHNPPSVAAIDAVRSVRPGVPQVACFDTGFHAGLPARASTYAVPRRWREEWGIRRFGFHGLSHDWASRRAGELLGRPRQELALVTAHIGAGASLCAVDHGHSVDTTMGFTPLEGIVMATRSGSIDPGIVVWVQEHQGLSAGDVGRILERESGLLGLSSDSGDLRTVLAAADAGDDDALLAYEVYSYRVRTGVAAMVAAMGSLDGLVFTGGAGEGSARLRADVCAGLGFLGVGLDGPANRAAGGDAVVSPPGAPTAVVVVEAREDLEMARQIRQLLGDGMTVG